MPLIVNDHTAPQRVPRTTDKLNSVDFRWYVVRTLPHQEEKLAGMLAESLPEEENILEVYCPTHTTVSVAGRDARAPLFAGHVFVLGTRRAVTDFLARRYPDGKVLYGRPDGGGRRTDYTVPEEQMRAFMDFNENYADKVIVLERPFSDYAFNPKTSEPNDMVKVVDGPLRGCEGYLVRFRNERRIVFRIKSPYGGDGLTVSVPNAWSLKAVRLHNAAADRQSLGTAKQRAVDMLVGFIGACGYGADARAVLYAVVDYLAATPTLVGLCRGLYAKGHVELSQRIAGLGARDAELLLNLARYEHDNPGYVRANFRKLAVRPFLTPTPGLEPAAGTDESRLSHDGFTEIIRRVAVAELTYLPDKGRDCLVTTGYFAHVGMMPAGGGLVLFANWDAFLGEYFLTAGRANERLVGGTTAPGQPGAQPSDGGRLLESFRNFAPTLYAVLTGSEPCVRAVKGLKVGSEELNVMAVHAADASPSAVDEAKSRLISVCVDICKEINSTVHLAVWRRYLRTVWLHG